MRHFLFLVIVILTASSLSAAPFFSYYDAGAFASVFYPSPSSLPSSISSTTSLSLSPDIIPSFWSNLILDPYQTKNKLMAVSPLEISAPLVKTSSLAVSESIKSLPLSATSHSTSFSTPSSNKLSSAQVIITNEGFEPKEIRIKSSQTIIWKNERKYWRTLVRGLREINDMDSGFLEPGDSFSWTFTEPGEYTYVDGVIIGKVGKIVVE